MVERGQEALKIAERNFYIAIWFAGLFSSVGLLAAWYVFKRVVQPITTFTDTMRLVAAGDLTREIPFEQRTDEIGMLARALRVFRDNAIEAEKLHLAKVGAEAANRTKSEFLANMSHELRTPLNAMLGWSQLLRSGRIGDGDLEAGLETIERNAKAQAQLVEDLLDVSRVVA